MGISGSSRRGRRLDEVENKDDGAVMEMWDMMKEERNIHENLQV